MDEERAREWASVFYDQALLSEGGRLEDPAGFVRRMNELFVAQDPGAGAAKSKPKAKAKTRAKAKPKAKPKAESADDTD